MVPGPGDRWVKETGREEHVLHALRHTHFTDVCQSPGLIVSLEVGDLGLQLLGGLDPFVVGQRQEATGKHVDTGAAVELILAGGTERRRRSVVSDDQRIIAAPQRDEDRVIEDRSPHCTHPDRITSVIGDDPRDAVHGGSPAAGTGEVNQVRQIRQYLHRSPYERREMPNPRG